MSFKNILCTYAGDSERGSGLAYAAAIAQRNGGWLTGALHHGTPRLETRYAGILADAVVRTIREADRKHISAAAEVFDRVTAKYGLTGRATFLELDPERGVGLSDLARTYDLTVCGVYPDSSSAVHLAARPEQIALQSGRPVLIVPENCRLEGPVRRALVAWDGKRAAARALGDALPLLGRGAEVVVLTVARRPSQDAPGGGVMAWLQRHGIAAESIHVEGGRTSVASIIRQTADAKAVDLVVMGAFEHAKFGQDMWGGVTHDMFDSATRPLFMSH